MNSKINKLKILVVLTLLSLGGAVTYSLYASDTALEGELEIASFIFNSNKTSEIELPLIDLKPGDVEEYLFSVNNNNLQKISNVSIEYQVIIKTYHFIPVTIELYRVNNNEDVLLFNCDESTERNAYNELECTIPIQEMIHSVETKHDYKLKIEFPEENNEEMYSDLVDYINLEIKGWQKIEE